MQKPTSAVSFLLTLTAFILFLAGIVYAVVVYQMTGGISQAVPSLKIESLAFILLAGWAFFTFFVPGLILLALAQISESTAASASHAEVQTELLRQIVADADARTSGGGPSVDDTARRIASEIHLKPRSQ
jgi:hypothetical protein